MAEAVRFSGRVSEAEKSSILTASDVLVGTSVREGWGLTVTEAAARGHSVGRLRLPGFRDSVVDGRTGLLVQPRTDALADGIARLLDDPELYDRLRSEGWRTATRLLAEARSRHSSRLYAARIRGGKGDDAHPPGTARMFVTSSFRVFGPVGNTMETARSEIVSLQRL